MREFVKKKTYMQKFLGPVKGPFI